MLFNSFTSLAYPLSISAADTLLSKLSSGNTEAIDKYHTLLRAGTSRPPLDVLRSAGVDFSTDGPIKSTLKSFDTFVTSFEGLCKNIFGV